MGWGCGHAEMQGTGLGCGVSILKQFYDEAFDVGRRRLPAHCLKQLEAH